MFNSEPVNGFSFGGSGPSLTEMDDDFLALLQNSNPQKSSYTTSPTTLITPTSANPADLGILHGSNSMNISPPSTESSPSPPNHLNSNNSAIDHDTPFRQNLYNNPNSMASRATRSSNNRDALTGEPSSKRKLLDDLDDDESDDDAPQRKFQHTDSAGL
jgi:hypothetical protein